MVRRDEHKHDDDYPNTKSSGRDRDAGLSLLESQQKAAVMAVAARALRTHKARRLRTLRDGSGKDA